MCKGLFLIELEECLLPWFSVTGSHCPFYCLGGKLGKSKLYLNSKNISVSEHRPLILHGEDMKYGFR